MSDAPFDPYHMWLGIPPEDQPPHHYRLLSIAVFEKNLDVIEAASQRQISHLRTYATGPNSELSQELLNEVAVARVTLLNPARKAEYDQALMQSQAGSKIDQARSQQSIESPSISTPTQVTAPSFSPSVTPAPKTSRGKAKKSMSWSKPLVGSILVAVIIVFSFAYLKARQKDPEVAQATPRAAIQPRQPSSSRGPSTRTYDNDQKTLPSSVDRQVDQNSDPSGLGGIESSEPLTTAIPDSDPAGTSPKVPTTPQTEEASSPPVDPVPMTAPEQIDTPDVQNDAPRPDIASFDMEQANDQNEKAQSDRNPKRRNRSGNTNELANLIVGKTLQFDYETPRAHVVAIFHPDGTWICHTTVRKTPVIAGRWEMRDEKLFAYENNRTDEGNGAIYNVYFLENEQLRTEHFYRNAKANQATAIIQPTPLNEPRPSFAAGQYGVQDLEIDKRNRGSRLLFEFAQDGEFRINGVKKGSWKIENGLLQMTTFSRDLKINPCLIYQDKFIGTYLNANKQPFYLVGSLNK
ncbi:MAG: hypothetical protein GY904_19030 [Planctomycetaceae bacterium]|nr:hypothetical protein [Planctomycetaceae bacterium]